MSRFPRPFRLVLLDAALLPIALVIVLVEEVFWPGGRAVLGALAGWRPLRRLHARLGRLPPWVALPLFLIPEGTSRAGFFASAWLVWVGQVRAAAILYAGTKLVAGLLAIWIYTACEPALLRVRWFRAGHDVLTRWRALGLAWLRARRPAGTGTHIGSLRQRIAARLPWQRR